MVCKVNAMPGVPTDVPRKDICQECGGGGKLQAPERMPCIYFQS